MKEDYFFLLVILCHISGTINGQSCTCDLHATLCDINCCCDTKCDAVDKNTFTKCEEINKNRIGKVCLSDSVLFSSNGKYQAQGSGGGLFCIYKDNYQERNFYSVVPTVSSESTFKTLASKYRKTSYASKVEATQTYQNSLKVGDLLFVLFESNQQGYISLPSSFGTDTCGDGNAARFQHPNISRCTRNINNLQKQCLSEPSWNASSYAIGFKVAPFPSFVFGQTRYIEVPGNGTSTITQVIPSTMNGTQLITPLIKLPLQCKEVSGIISNCTFNALPNPSYKDNKCNNVVLEVKYDIGYKTNVTTEISTVDVSFVLGSISSTSSEFLQQHSITFRQISTNNVTTPDNTTVINRSGNPGYITGYPVISGNLFTDAFTSKDKIAVNENSPLSIIKVTSSGLCSASSSRLPVTFGMDVRTGCFETIKNVMSVTDCQTLQDNIYNVLLKNLPTYIASFGDSSGVDVSEWVKILNKRPTTKPSTSNGQCLNMVTGVTFEILYARTGYIVNPQNQIVGVEEKYDASRSLLFQCFGLLCQSVTRKVEISQSVSFIDVSATPQAEVKSRPTFKAKAPTDFFYPFL